MSSKITVVTATYNRAYILPKAINSILEQSFNDWEHIIVDDGSEDNTEEIVSEYIKKDHRIKYIKLDRNQGQSVALNKGIEMAGSPLISFLDSDDQLHPDYLKKQVKFFHNNPDAGLCYAGADYYFNNKKVRTLHIKTSGNAERYLYKRFKGIGGSTFTVQRSVFDKTGMFDVAFPSLKDYDLLLRIARDYNFGYLENCNTRVQLDSGNRITDNKDLEALGKINIFNKYKDRGKEIGVYHHLCRKMARLYAYSKKDLGTAYKYLFESVKHRPFYIYSYLYAFKLPFLYFKTLK